jgi:hypothetical protein
MERSAIREQCVSKEEPLPHYAEFIIGPAQGRTRWLHAGYCCFAGDVCTPLIHLRSSLAEEGRVGIGKNT